ncbi:hypothetical protein MRX96_008422 [Rhipicephalus microplus]
MVAWPSRFNDSTGSAVDQFLAHLPDFRGYYIEIYLDAISAIRNREMAQLLDQTPGSEDKIAREEDGPFPGMRPAVRYSAWYGSILVSPSAVLEPLFFNGSDPLSMGAFGHLVAHELWHAALGEMPLGAASQSDLTLGDEHLKRHQCIAEFYTKAGAPKQDAAKGSSESVADLVGLEVAYALYREGNGSSPSKGGDVGNVTDITGFTTEHLFFVTSCLKWCAATPDSLSKTSLGYITPRMRCNVPVAVMDRARVFAEAFRPARTKAKWFRWWPVPTARASTRLPMQPPRDYNITA